MKFEEYFADYIKHLEAVGFAKSTIVQKKIYTGRCLNYLKAMGITDIKAVTREHLDQYFTYLKNEYRTKKGLTVLPTTYGNNITDTHQFFDWLEKNNHILISPVIDPPRTQRLKLPEVLSEAEILKILDSCPINTPLGARDRAILELLYSTGIRKSELIKLNLQDFNREQGEIRINQGKGKKDRLVPVGDYAGTFISMYLKLIRPWMVKSAEEPALFVDSGSDFTFAFCSKKLIHSLVDNLRLWPGRCGIIQINHSLRSNIFGIKSAGQRFIGSVFNNCSPIREDDHLFPINRKVKHEFIVINLSNSFEPSLQLLKRDVFQAGI